MRATYPTALVLQALLDGHHHGFDIMAATGLASGTVYPILRRLDAEALVRSRWERETVAHREQRPPRRVTPALGPGRAFADAAIARHAALSTRRLDGFTPGPRRTDHAPPAHMDAPRPGPAPPRRPYSPGAQRADWHAEWVAEPMAEADRPTASSGASGQALLRHALGAPVDALWMRQRAVADLTIVDDFRGGWRQLRLQAAFALTAIGVLALGMGASVTAFSVVTQLLLRPLPYPDADRVVTIWERKADATGTSDVAPGNFLDWRARATSFVSIAGAEPYSYDYTGGERPEVLRAAQVTEGFFDVFGLPPLAGRYFRPEEHKKGANRVAVVSARLWRSHFGADPQLVDVPSLSTMGPTPSSELRRTRSSRACPRRSRDSGSSGPRKPSRTTKRASGAPGNGKSRADWPRGARWPTRGWKWRPSRHESRSSSRARTRVRAWSCCPSGNISSGTYGRP